MTETSVTENRDRVREWEQRRAHAYAVFNGTVIAVRDMLRDKWIDADRAIALLTEGDVKLAAVLDEPLPPPRFPSRAPAEVDASTGLTIYNPEGTREVAL